MNHESSWKELVDTGSLLVKGPMVPAEDRKSEAEATAWKVRDAMYFRARAAGYFLDHKYFHPYNATVLLLDKARSFEPWPRGQNGEYR